MLERGIKTTKRIKGLPPVIPVAIMRCDFTIDLCPMPNIVAVAVVWSAPDRS